MCADLVTIQHLNRRAIVYVRQSTPHQVVSNQESLRLQYALRERAKQLGWHDTDVEVVDADLGLSGASTVGRQGFKDLVARVALGEIGLILSVDVTRLARNCSDWYPLLDLCGRNGCLIGDRDGLYDPALPDGRLVLGLKGTISEMELHTIRSRLTSGLLSKASRGELALPLPAGLARDPSGVVVQDPDQEVRSRIALVFSTFLRQRTAVQVARMFHAGDLTLPRRNRHGDVCWQRATIAAITSILHNPAYAGAFVYGRSRPGMNGQRNRRRSSTAEWRIVVKGRYPAYIDWDTFERIQAMLADNHTDYQRVHGRGVPRDGAALLHGILWCGECGHKMVVSYKPNSRYVCNFLHRQQGAEHQECVSAAPIDDVVVRAFLHAVVPAELDALRRARQMRRDAEDGLQRAAAQQVERLRYQASLAERQFNRVDPDNRLVAAELERRWEAALVELRRAEEALAHTQAEPVPDADRRQLYAKATALGQRLPAIWADPATDRAQRKALLRCLIDKVILRRVARSQAAVRIVWRGGATTDLTIDLPVTTLAALPRAFEFEARIVELAESGLHDNEIAQALMEDGYRSAHETVGVLPSTVRRIRARHGIKFVARCTRWPHVPGWLSVADAATRLCIPEKWLRQQLRSGVIETRCEPNGRHLLPDDPEAFAALERLRSGAVQKICLLPSLL